MDVFWAGSEEKWESGLGRCMVQVKRSSSIRGTISSISISLFYKKIVSSTFCKWLLGCLLLQMFWVEVSVIEHGTMRICLYHCHGVIPNHLEVVVECLRASIICLLLNIEHRCHLSSTTWTSTPPLFATELHLMLQFSTFLGSFGVTWIFPQSGLQWSHLFCFCQLCVFVCWMWIHWGERI